MKRSSLQKKSKEIYAKKFYEIDLCLLNIDVTTKCDQIRNN